MKIVPDSAIEILTVKCIFGLIVPIAVLFICKYCAKLKLFPAFIGAFTYIDFECVISTFASTSLLASFPRLSATISEKAVAYAAFVGLFSAIFGESGRFISFRYIMNGKYPGVRHAFAYGIGQSCIELFIVLGLSSAFYLLFSASVNYGISTEEISGAISSDPAAISATIAELSGLNARLLFLTIIERTVAFAAGILLSLLMQYSAARNSLLHIIGCFILHFAVSFCIAYIPSLQNALLAEALFAITVCAGLVIFTKKCTPHDSSMHI